MYRKPLLTIEDAEALTGQLVRLEWSTHSAPLIGIVTGASDPYILYRNQENMDKRLMFIQGTYVVYATTDVDVGSEQPFRVVRWRDRPGQEAEAISAYRSGIVNPGTPYPPLNLQPSGYLQRWAAEQFLLFQGDSIDVERPRLQEVQTPLQRGERLHYDFSNQTV